MEPMTCPQCSRKISFLSSLFRASNLFFNCPDCQVKIGVRLDKNYWLRQMTTAPLYIVSIIILTQIKGLDPIFSIKNILIFLIIIVIGTYEGWRFFWFLELKEIKNEKKGQWSKSV